jgi:Cu(I)/Ag(I) efflux system membrane protein CusA/SilA
MAIETAMIMTIYLNEAMNKMVEKHGNSKTITTDILRRTLLMALQKTEAKINDGFGFSIWISTHSLVHRDGADVMIPITVPLIEEQSPLLYMYY